MAVALIVAAFVAGCSNDTATGDDTTPSAVDVAASPTEVTWRPYQGVEVPYSTVDGPTADTASAAPTGYTATPQGAVLAAIQGQARLALAPDTAWATVTRTLVAPGDGRDAYAIARSAASITDAADPATTAAFTGFRVSSYDDTRAVVEVATTMPGGQLTAVPVTVLRATGDWKIALPAPTGGEDDPTAPAPTDPIPLTSMDGFTAFSAP
ncbi:hypothetical protein [Rhodococcus sp. SORGH_AS_0301]|uniref:hypothetical protein n=1 Tax=Rhodococcus sp. SORGH_AS_0301 TaxID=3041780 RepID=UPI0027D7719A|nr:hypothetical protein [Rhodococcus sp. SORGH_AS_0301]